MNTYMILETGQAAQVMHLLLGAAARRGGGISMGLEDVVIFHLPFFFLEEGEVKKKGEKALRRHPPPPRYTFCIIRKKGGYSKHLRIQIKTLFFDYVTQHLPHHLR